MSFRLEKNKFILFYAKKRIIFVKNIFIERNKNFYTAINYFFYYISQNNLIGMI